MSELSNASELAQSAIRLDNDINGNPRYYLPILHAPAAPLDHAWVIVPVYPSR